MLALSFLNFWFIELPIGLFQWLLALNKVLLQFSSLPLLAHTFLKPIKNEYREGLVGFSIAMGIVVKALLILLEVPLLIIVLALEVIFFVIILLFPILSILFPFTPL